MAIHTSDNSYEHYILPTDIIGSHSSGTRAFYAWEDTNYSVPVITRASPYNNTYSIFQQSTSISAGNVIVYHGFVHSSSYNPYDIDTTNSYKAIYNDSTNQYLASNDDRYYFHYINNKTIGLAIRPLIIYEPYASAEIFLDYIADLFNNYNYKMSIEIDTYVGAYANSAPSIPSGGNSSLPSGYDAYDSGSVVETSFHDAMTSSSYGANGILWNKSYDGNPGSLLVIYGESFWGTISDYQNDMIVFGVSNYPTQGTEWIPIYLTVNSSSATCIYLLIKSRVELILTDNYGNRVAIKSAFMDHSQDQFGLDLQISGSDCAAQPLPQVYAIWEVYGPIYRIYVPSTISVEYDGNGSNYPYILSSNILYRTIRLNYSKDGNLLLLHSNHEIGISTYGSTPGPELSDTSSTVSAVYPIYVYRNGTTLSTNLSLTNDVYSSSQDKTISLTKYISYEIYLYDWEGNIIYRQGQSDRIIAVGAEYRGYGEYITSDESVMEADNNPKIYVSQGDTVHIFLREVMKDDDEGTFFDYPCGDASLGSYPSSLTVTLENYSINNRTVPSAANNIYYSDFYTSSSKFNSGNYTSKLHELNITVGNISSTNPGEEVGRIIVYVNELSEVSGHYEIPIFRVNTVPLTGMSLKYGTTSNPTTTANVSPSTNSVSPGTVTTTLYLESVPDPSTATEVGATLSVSYSNGAAGDTVDSSATSIGNIDNFDITKGGTVTVTYTYNSGTTKSYIFNVTLLVPSTSFRFSADPESYLEPGQRDYFRLQWNGSEVWSSSKSSNEPGYIDISITPNTACSIDPKSSWTYSDSSLKVPFTAGEDERYGLQFIATLTKCDGNTITAYSSTFDIVGSISNISAQYYGASSSSSALATASSNNITSINDKIWYNDSITLYFQGTGTTDAQTVKPTYLTVSGGPNNNFNTSSNPVNSSKIGITFSGYNRDRNTTIVKYADSNSNNPSVYAGFSFIALLYSTELTPTSSRYSVDVGDSVDITVQWNGDEYYSELSNFSCTTSGLSGAIVSTNISSGNNPYSNIPGTFICTINTQGITTKTGTVTISCKNVNGTVISTTVQLTVNVPEVYYTLIPRVDTNNGYKSKVYGLERTRLRITSGGFVTSGVLTLPNGIQYSTNGSSWSTGSLNLNFSNSNDVYVFIRNITTAVLGEQTITVTADQYDSGKSYSGYEDTCTVTFGQIEYSVNTYNGTSSARGRDIRKDTVYIGDNVEFIATFTPSLNSSDPSIFWSSRTDLGNIQMIRWSPGYSNEHDDYILQGMVIDTSPAATFNYSNDDGNYHNFSFVTVRDRSVDTNALKVPGNTLVIKGIHTTPPTLRDSSIDIPISGTTIVSIDDASFVGITGQDANLSKATDASLSLWIDNTTLWSSVKDAPDSTAGYNYTIILTGTNDLGDTVVNNSAGILHWKIGRDNFVFSSDPSTASVVGSANKTATFNVVCSYKDNEVIHYCQDVSIASNSGSAWCNASIVNNETSYTVTITTTAKNYTLNNKTATIVLSTKWDESQGEAETINIIFIQEPLLVGVTFNLSVKNDSDNNTIINSDTKSLSTTYKTRGSYSKEYTIECIREERETINDASAEVTVSCKLGTGSTANNTNGFSRSIMSPGNGQSDYFRITSSDNSGDDGQDRSAQYILITNHQGSNTLETSELAANYNVTYQVTVSQEGCRYSNFTLKINGETASSVDFGKSSRAGTNVEIPIVCTYIKTVDNTTETKQGQWYPIYDSLPTWLTSIDPASNTNVSDRNLKFTVISNTDTESRDYTLSINTSFNGYGSAVTRTLHIIQSGTSTEFVPSTKIVDASTTSFTVDITSDDSWALVEYENRPNWITSVTPTANNVPNAEEVYDSSVNVVLAEHFSLTAANDYVKYRTTTNDRTATITAESSSNVNTSLGITQQGYSWSKTCNYPPVINLTSGQVKFTFTVASNYQIKLTGTERLTIPAEGIPGPSFNSTDGAEVVNSLTYDVSIKCNASASPKESIITILQDRIADEDDLNTSGSAYYQSNIITVKQPAASYTRYGSLQIIHDGNVVTPIENNDYGKVEFASAGNGATQIITVRSELGGWYLDSSSEAYLNSPESWITFRKNGEDVRGDRGFEENDSSAFKNVDIAIKCNTWNDVHNDRSVYLTFVHDVSSNIIAKLQVFQKKSDVQFALVASNDASLNGSTDLKDIILLLKERKINDPITSGYLLSAPIENEAVSLSYYLYYYIGGADKEDISQPITDIFKKVYENYVSIKSQFPSDCISAIEWTILSPEGNINPLDPTNYANGYWPAIPPECDWSDFNSTRVANINSEKIYKINLRIAKNENVYEKLHELKINSEANSSLEVKIQLLQPGATYSADFAFIDPTTIGEWSSRQNAYIIPVYGGSYPITVRNKLRYDTISIVNIYIDDNNTTTNVDETDFSNWASFKYLNSNGDYQDFDPNNPVILKEDVQGEDTANQQFMIVINPYTKKEGQETADDISNDRNKKLYRVYFVATSSSKPTTEITKVVTNSTATMEIVGVQDSMDLRKTTWKLISDETRQDERTGSFKIFARTDISDGQNRILYSNDTGYTLINYNGSKVVENIAAEEDVIKNMFDGTLLEGQAALDERIGVRIYGNN